MIVQTWMLGWQRYQVAAFWLILIQGRH